MSKEKSCQNCKYFDIKKKACNSKFWKHCIIRDKEGFVIFYKHHKFKGNEK